MNTHIIREEVLAFRCQGERLVGVVSLPAQVASDLALLVVVGGPQVRMGSHRQFTDLCRALAAVGVPAMRFDVRGMGDSSGPLHTFEHISDDITAALDALQAQLPDVRRVVLWGLCDGASAALMLLNERNDARVAGLVLLNPWVRSVQTLARAHVKYYYLNRLRQREFWGKLLSGGVALKALRNLAISLRATRFSAIPDAGASLRLPFQECMLRGAEGFAGPTLWVLSGHDYTAREFIELTMQTPRWRAVVHHLRAEWVDMAEADHTFSARRDQIAVTAATVTWMQKLRISA